MNLPEEVLYCLKMIKDSGKEAYVVGGAVRSFLLGLEIHDYDLTTSALPFELQEIFKNDKVIETGLKHGTVTILKNHLPIEITTYRKDTTYEDHRHPDCVVFTSSLEEDLKRRDFTMNAIAYHPDTGFIDLFDGIHDIKHERIRTVGKASIRFEEDALRIIRALRFSSELGFTIEQDTSSSIHHKKEDLTYIAMERIMVEFTRLLEGNYVEDVLKEYKDVLEVFLPILKEYSKDDWDTLIKQISSSKNDFIIRFSLLLTPIKDKLPDDFYRYLKFSNDLKRRIKAFLTHETTSLDTTSSLRYLCHDLEDDIQSYIEYRCGLEPSINQNELQTKIERILKEDTYTLKQLKINGHDLLKLGLQGKQIQEILEFLLDAVIQEKCPNEYEALLNYYKTSLISSNKL